MTREELHAALDLSRRAGVLRVRNVLNPLLWLTATVMPACFVAGGFIGYQSWLGVLVTLAGLVPATASLIFYMVFALRDPDRLQSEEYAIRSLELRLVERRGIPPVMLSESELQPDPAVSVNRGEPNNGP